MNESASALTKNKVLAVSAIGFLLSFAAFFPGFMTGDSYDQYKMAQTLQFSDWHPPIMSWVWSIFNAFSPGPQGIMGFHLFILWLSIYLWYGNFENYRRAWTVLLVGFLPFIINFSGVVWKDVGMCFALSAAAAISMRPPSKTNIFLFLIFIFYAFGLRYNAVFAIVPLLVFTVSRWAPKRGYFFRALIVAVLLATLNFGVKYFNYDVLKASVSHPFGFTMRDDLLYLSLQKNESLIHGISIQQIRECGAQEVGQTLLIGRWGCVLSNTKIGPDSPSYEQEKSHWLDQIFKSPLDYAYYRLSAFGYLLRDPSSTPFYYWSPGIGPNEMGVVQRENGMTILVRWWVQTTASLAPFLYKPYFWLLLNIILFCYTFIAAPSTRKGIVRALSVSSTFYMLGYIPVTPMADFRYVYWSVLASTLAIFIWAFKFVPPKDPRSRSTVIFLIFTVTMSGLIPNFSKIFAANPLDAIAKGMHGEAIGTPNYLNDLKYSNNVLVHTGPNPYAEYGPIGNNTVQLPRKIHVIFSCYERKGDFAVEISATQNPNISSVYSIGNFTLKDGVNILELNDFHDVISSSTFPLFLRISALTPNSCAAFTIKSAYIF